MTICSLNYRMSVMWMLCAVALFFSLGSRSPRFDSRTSSEFCRKLNYATDINILEFFSSLNSTMEQSYDHQK